MLNKLKVIRCHFNHDLNVICEAALFRHQHIKEDLSIYSQPQKRLAIVSLFFSLIIVNVLPVLTVLYPIEEENARKFILSVN
jgi:hypothetical protein